MYENLTTPDIRVKAKPCHLISDLWPGHMTPHPGSPKYNAFDHTSVLHCLGT